MGAALSLACLLTSTAGCRATNPVRAVSGDARISIKRASTASALEWRIVTLNAAWEAAKSKDVGKAIEAVRSGKQMAVVTRSDPKDNKKDPEALLPRGGYGEVYLLHVKEGESGGDGDSTADNVSEKDAAARQPIRNTVEILDDRDAASAGGSHVSLLFLPELDAIITSVQFSLYPARLWAVDKRDGWNVAALTDGLSFDAGIAGGSVVGDAPPELNGRIAFTFGGGFTFTKGWAVKVGSIVYRDVTDKTT